VFCWQEEGDGTDTSDAIKKFKAVLPLPELHLPANWETRKPNPQTDEGPLFCEVWPISLQHGHVSMIFFTCLNMEVECLP
jgi:hypothetical protein